MALQRKRSGGGGGTSEPSADGRQQQLVQGTSLNGQQLVQGTGLNEQQLVQGTGLGAARARGKGWRAWLGVSCFLVLVLYAAAAPSSVRGGGWEAVSDAAR